MSQAIDLKKFFLGAKNSFLRMTQMVHIGIFYKTKVDGKTLKLHSLIKASWNF